VEDIFEEILPQLDAPFRERVKSRPSVSLDSSSPLDGEEAVIYNLLSFEPTHIDDLISKAALSAAQVAALLLSLELKNFVRQLPGHCYLRI
jgi:DNA processing protein